MRINKIMWLALASVLVVLAACSQKPAPVAPQTGPTAAPSGPAVVKTGWEAEWDKILKGANKEGKIVLYGPPIAETRVQFIESFQKAYPGIALDYVAMTGSQVGPKIAAERRAGIYQVDLHVGGTTTILSTLRQFAEPIQPHLILPDVKDPKQWFEGRLDFADDTNEINLVFTINTSARVVFNSSLVDPKKMDGISYWEFTKPEWKGKMIYWDPRIAGSGLAQATFWYSHPDLGLEYIKAIAANGVVLSRDQRVMAEQVGRGKYNIVFSPDVALIIDLQKAGLPLAWANNMKEGSYASASFGSVIYMDKAPHPNAATVFLNWLLSKEAQAIWTTSSGYASRRLDAPVDHLLPEMRPKEGVFYQLNYKEKYVNMRDEIGEQLNKIFAGF